MPDESPYQQRALAKRPAKQVDHGCRAARPTIPIAWHLALASQRSGLPDAYRITVPLTDLSVPVAVGAPTVAGSATHQTDC